MNEEILKCSPALRAIAGDGPHTRVTLTRAVWGYIVDHDLIDEDECVTPDEKLAKVLRTNRKVDAHELTRRINGDLADSDRA